jgi:hypothetical protein
MQTTSQSVPKRGSVAKSPSFWFSFAAKIGDIVCNERFTPLLLIGILYLIVSFLLRVLLFVVFGFAAGTSAITLLPTICIGIANDTITLCYLLAPFSLYLLLMPRKMHQSLPGRVMVVTMTWIAYFVVLYQAVAQYYFFKEFTSRFNLVAVDYLIYPHEVFVNIYESYHVVSISVLIAIYACILLRFSWKYIAKTTAAVTARFSRRAQFFLLHLPLFFQHTVSIFLRTESSMKLPLTAPVVFLRHCEPITSTTTPIIKPESRRNSSASCKHSWQTTPVDRNRVIPISIV